MMAGQIFTEFINQGNRVCQVIASDGPRYLYEYEMPNGSSSIRNEKGRPVSYRSLSKKWLRFIEDQFGILNLIARPQQSGRTVGLTAELLRKLSEVPENTDANGTSQAPLCTV